MIWFDLNDTFPCEVGLGYILWLYWDDYLVLWFDWDLVIGLPGRPEIVAALQLIKMPINFISVIIKFISIKCNKHYFNQCSLFSKKHIRECMYIHKLNLSINSSNVDGSNGCLFPRKWPANRSVIVNWDILRAWLTLLNAGKGS